eukprot:TRINITY_DN1891_c0_g1_i9.p2 TRINITY_DN1891_c0_g1~~TRINITY_DN1891_c0_g1_i9.p2  ORF type:complete len:186 (+),score=-27.75 TRINITY_DN1891_c0_g1_i9:987-1544(+)
MIQILFYVHKMYISFLVVNGSFKKKKINQKKKLNHKKHGRINLSNYFKFSYLYNYKIRKSNQKYKKIFPNNIYYIAIKVKSQFYQFLSTTIYVINLCAINNHYQLLKKQSTKRNLIIHNLDNIIIKQNNHIQYFCIVQLIIITISSKVQYSTNTYNMNKIQISQGTNQQIYVIYLQHNNQSYYQS